ncbi:PREDICTED: WASH complex subunit 7 [Ceratosolen solmsi marchali]|uniref:WASH complex subunit 7 n=1 Tax=Ceratosolen solmsi marchali TaxID=326594 RepID=A0AAJ6YT54_9HYME|nr:PREDICTED: WASH complex subunit 7 [Ceratosolen solmsi marchali]
MIESPVCDLKRDDTVYKTAGAAHLKKYGQFFENLAEKYWQDSSVFEYVIEGPIRLIYKVNEDISILSLAETDNKIFSKLLASIGGTCREIRLLKAEASKFYIKLFNHGERCADHKDHKIESLLSDLQDLSIYINRIMTVIHLTVKQLSNLANNIHQEIYLPVLIDYLLDLFIILVILDALINSQPALVEKWNIYRFKVKSVYNSAQFNIPQKRLLTYEKLLKDLHIQLLSKKLFLKAIEYIMDINKTTIMCDHILCFLRNVITDVENKINDNATINKSWMQANIGIVIVIKLFGACDKKLLKRIIETNKKLYAVSLLGNIVWLPNDFLTDCLPRDGIIAIPLQVGEKLLVARVQRLPSIVSNLINRALIWVIEMQNILIKTGFQIFSEIEKKRNLLVEILILMRQIKENITFVTNLHAFLLKPMNRSTVQLICQLIEVQKSLETTFHTLAPIIVLSQSQVLQQLTYQILTILETVRKSLIQKGKVYSKEKLDVLSLVGSSMKLINGPATADRRLILRCALVCASQLTESFKEEEVVKLRFYLDTYDTIAELYNLLLESCDYSVLLHQQSILPAYLSLVIDNNSNISHIVHLFNAFNSAISKQELSDLIEFKISEQRKILIRNIFEPACSEIETNLRLHVHAHLKLNDTNPFKVGIKDGNRIIRSCPLLINGKLLYVKRYIEHYLDYTFYNLTTIALHDWKTYRIMHALTNHKLGLETVQNHLPTQILEQGLDALEIMRNIHIFVSRYLYNLHTQTFIEHLSSNKHLNTISIRHIANSIRTHGTGIMSTTVNFVYQFLRIKLHTFSQFLFDEHIKSRLIRDARFIRSQKEKGAIPYSYERAEKFQKGIRRLGMTSDGLSYLDQFRQLITQIGNALGYIRLIRSGGLHASSNAISFLPDINSSTKFNSTCKKLNFLTTTQIAAKRLEDDIANLVRNFTEGIHYFKLLVDVFASAFRDSNNCYHLQQFYAIIPPLTFSFIDNILSNKEKLFKKNKSGAAFTDDGFAVGVAYINALLDQNNELDGLQWFKTVNEYFIIEKSAAESKAEYEDEKLQQTRALTLKRLEERRAEFQLLYYSLSGARVFFKQLDE